MERVKLCRPIPFPFYHVSFVSLQIKPFPKEKKKFRLSSSRLAAHCTAE